MARLLLQAHFALLVSTIIPLFDGGLTYEAEIATEAGSFIDLEIPPLGVMTALVTAFVFGIGMSQCNLIH